MQTHEHQRVTFLLHQRINLAVVIAFVLATQDEHGRCGHRFERVPAGVDVRCFAVVDPTYVANGGYILQPVLHAFERRQTLAYHIVLDMQQLRGDGCCHRVVLVMFAFERQQLYRQFQRRERLHHHLPFFYVRHVRRRLTADC